MKTETQKQDAGGSLDVAAGSGSMLQPTYWVPLDDVLAIKPLDRTQSRKTERPIASESNRARLISIYMHRYGFSFEEAEAKFERENRKAWARACACA